MAAIWCHNAKGLLQGDMDDSAIKNSSVAITSCNFCFFCSGSWHTKRRRRRRLVTCWWSSVQTCATTSNIMMKLTCGTGKCFNNSPRHTHQWEHTHVFTYCEDCWVQSCHCLFGKSIALLCPAHTCFEIDFVSISMAMILLIEQFFLLIHGFFFIAWSYVTYNMLYRKEPLSIPIYYMTKLYVTKLQRV